MRVGKLTVSQSYLFLPINAISQEDRKQSIKKPKNSGGRGHHSAKFSGFVGTHPLERFPTLERSPSLDRFVRVIWEFERSPLPCSA